MTSATEKTLILRDGQLTTKVYVRGDGPPLVFLHGEFGVKWDSFLEDLSNSFTVYAPLHPGLTEPEDIRRLETLWDLVLYHYELFDALELQSPAVIGHSYGGMLAAELAATNPDRVSKLIIMSALGFWRDDKPIADWTAMPREDLIKLSFYEPEGDIAKSVTAEPEDEEMRKDELINATWAQACAGKFTWPIPDKGLKHRIHRVKAPTMVIWGENDGVVDPVYAREFVGRMGNAKVALKLVGQAAHMPHLERRQHVVGLIEQFLT